MIQISSSSMLNNISFKSEQKSDGSGGVRFLFYQFIQWDKSDAVILDMDLLLALVTGLVQGIHIDVLHKFLSVHKGQVPRCPHTCMLDRKRPPTFSVDGLLDWYAIFRLDGGELLINCLLQSSSHG